MLICFEARHTNADSMRDPPRGSRDLSILVRRRLQASPYPALRRIECDGGDGIVILRGQVSSYFLKQLAQELVRGLPGLEGIANLIVVAAGSRSAGASAMGEAPRRSLPAR